MSVAEALGVKVRGPNVNVRRSRYYAGLNLGDLGTYQHNSRPGEDNNRNMKDSMINLNLQDADYLGNERQQFGHYSPNKQHQSIKEDMYRLKEDPEDSMRERKKGEEESMQNNDDNRTIFSADQRNQDHISPRKREPDLFLDTLGGPGGTVLRQKGFPPLTDPHFVQQQQLYQQYQAASRSDGRTHKDIEEYRRQQADQGYTDTNITKQQQWIENLRKQIDQVKYKSGDEEHGSQYSYGSVDLPATAKLNEARSLDLGSSRGGAGAPIKDLWGKNVTRMPITLSRDDYGESKIKEDIPGKATFNLDFTNEDSKPYYPWGGQGAGAPLRNRDGYIVTQVYGKLGAANDMEGELRRKKRRQEVLFNELKECARQQKENRDELTRYLKAPQGELAELLQAGRVGKPKRDEITGEIGQHHLPNSDISKLKMNYQPVPMSQKKIYHDELVKMAEERHHKKQLEKLKEMQESNAHFQNMDSTWGAFGGGAPKHHVIRKKANLTNSLFFPQQQVQRVEDNDYLPPTGLGSFLHYQTPNMNSQKMFTEDNRLSLATPRDLRLTARSSHKNLFDVPSDQRLTGSSGHRLAPYATSGVE